MARNELNFTKENIVALPLPEAGKRDEYYDTKVQGLQIRITAAGVKTFYVYRWVRAEGNRYKKWGRHHALWPMPLGCTVTYSFAIAINPS